MRASDVGWVAPLAGLPQVEVAAVARTARLVEYRRGAWLLPAAAPESELVIVVEGIVRLVRRRRDGAELTLGLVRPGELLTAAPLVGGTRDDDRAQALGRVRALAIPLALVSSPAPAAPHLLARLLACALARRDAAYADAAACATVPERLLRVLRRLARPGAPGEAAMAPLALPLSHADLARLANADRATVTRALRDLEGRGLVRRARGHVVAVAPATPPARGDGSVG